MTTLASLLYTSYLWSPPITVIHQRMLMLGEIKMQDRSSACLCSYFIRCIYLSFLHPHTPTLTPTNTLTHPPSHTHWNTYTFYWRVLPRIKVRNVYFNKVSQVEQFSTASPLTLTETPLTVLRSMPTSKEAVKSVLILRLTTSKWQPQLIVNQTKFLGGIGV